MLQRVRAIIGLPRARGRAKPVLLSVIALSLFLASCSGGGEAGPPSAADQTLTGDQTVAEEQTPVTEQAPAADQTPVTEQAPTTDQTSTDEQTLVAPTGGEQVEASLTDTPDTALYLAPLFELPSSHGRPVSLDLLLQENQAVVIVFYEGVH